jgi:hypothetical protein
MPEVVNLVPKPTFVGPAVPGVLGCSRNLTVSRQDPALARPFRPTLNHRVAS